MTPRRRINHTSGLNCSLNGNNSSRNIVRKKGWEEVRRPVTSFWLSEFHHSGSRIPIKAWLFFFSLGCLFPCWGQDLRYRAGCGFFNVQCKSKWPLCTTYVFSSLNASSGQGFLTQLDSSQAVRLHSATRVEWEIDLHPDNVQGALDPRFPAAFIVSYCHDLTEKLEMGSQCRPCYPHVDFHVACLLYRSLLRYLLGDVPVMLSNDSGILQTPGLLCFPLLPFQNVLAFL